MKNAVLLLFLAAAVAKPAMAVPYYYEYEGLDYPENEGWEHYASDPAPERWLEDGALYIDSRGIVGRQRQLHHIFR